MTEKTKIIFDFCKGRICFRNLDDEIKKELFKNDIVTEQGELTEEGLALKYAVLEYL